MAVAGAAVMGAAILVAVVVTLIPLLRRRNPAGEATSQSVYDR